MTVIETIVQNLIAEIDRIVEQKVEQKMPEMIRALTLREVEPASEELVDVLEVARILGRDLSSPEKVRAAKKHVYNLARQDLIPSVRLSERCVRFNLVQVRKVLAEGGKAKAA